MTLAIGWSSKSITPDKPVLLHGQFHVRVSTHVEDPVTVTALAIESDDGAGGRGQVVIVSADLCAIPEPVLRAARAQLRTLAPDLNPRLLLASGTHTHTSLTLSGEYYRWPGRPVATPAECARLAAQAIAEAAAEAWRARRPGAISNAFGHAVVGHNRRAVYRDGSAAMYGKTNVETFECLEGYEDHSLDLLFTWDKAGRLTGVLLNLACPSQVTEGANYVSADFWHETREALRARHGAGLFVLPQCAPAGDQSPHFLLYGKQEEFMRQRRGVSERQEIARRLAAAVDDVLATARPAVQKDAVLKHHVETLRLTARSITDAEAATARNDLAEVRKAKREEVPGWHRIKSLRARDVLKRYAAQAKDPRVPVELHVLRLGDLAMATNPFELFLDYGLRMKARSPALQTFLVQLACGTRGYLPTRRAIESRSYGAGAADNLVGPEGGQELVERTLALIERLQS